MKVAVIGGGPSGIATLKFLATAHTFFPIPPIEVRLFEAADRIGGTFVQRVYEDAELVSSKYLTAFSDFRLPASAPDFLTPAAYVAYLTAYIAHFSLQQHIHTSARVTRVSRAVSPRGHVVEYTLSPSPSSSSSSSHTSSSNTTAEKRESWLCDAVAMCTGLNVHPRIPHIPGIEHVPLALHSSAVKTRAQLGEGTHVVVLGAGETAMDMAHLAVTAATASIIPTPISLGRAPKATAPNKPVDTSVASLFDTAYAHPLLQRGPLLWWAYDQWVRGMHWCISGTEEGPDQWVGQMTRERKHVDSLFMVKSDRALPYLSANHRSTSLLQRIRSRILNVPLRPNHDKTIAVRPWPTSITPSGELLFPPSPNPPKTPLVPDILIFATGYDATFPILDPSYPSLAAASVRGIYSPADLTLSYIGFLRPSIGAIPPLAELQAQLWTLRLLQHLHPARVPTSLSPDAVEPYEVDYRLRPRGGYDVYRDKRGVDHESYAYQLALDMGAAPRLRYMARQGWRCWYAWAMGSNFNTKFRMVGPWRDGDAARGIMRGELYGVVRRTGGVVYFVTYSLIPLFVFGSISIWLYVLFWVASLPRKAALGVRRVVTKQKVVEKSLV